MLYNPNNYEDFILAKLYSATTTTTTTVATSLVATQYAATVKSLTLTEVVCSI
jgi:hypothetical protein